MLKVTDVEYVKKKTIITALIAIAMFASCSSDPQWADPEAHEKTEQLQKQYGPLLVGTWHCEYVGDKQCFFERLTFREGGTLTGYRKWQTRSLVTIDGEQRYTDWHELEEECGTFTGTWSLRYWSPEGNEKEKRNCLTLIANFDAESQHQQIVVAYSNTCDFSYANETTLRIQGYYIHDDDGWINYQRGEAEPSF